MDKYQKKALGVVAIGGILLYAGIITVFGLGWIGSILLIIAGGVFCALFLLINRWIKPYLNNKEYPNNDWYREHLERNYDAIILGDECCEGAIDINDFEGKKVFDLSLKDQNLYADFAVLKNTFSILREEGEVVIPIRTGSIKYSDCKFIDERRYYWALSPYVFNPNRFSCMLKKIYMRIPALMLRGKDIVYVVRSIFHDDIARYDMTRKLEKEEKWLLSTREKVIRDLEAKQQSMLFEMNQFCKERNLILKIIRVK